MAKVLWQNQKRRERDSVRKLKWAKKSFYIIFSEFSEEKMIHTGKCVCDRNHFPNGSEEFISKDTLNAKVTAEHIEHVHWNSGTDLIIRNVCVSRILLSYQVKYSNNFIWFDEEEEKKKRHYYTWKMLQEGKVKSIRGKIRLMIEKKKRLGANLLLLWV